MAEPLPSIAAAGAQSSIVIIASLASGVDASLLQILVSGTGGALAARVFAPIPTVPLGFGKAFAIFLISVMMAGFLGGFAIEVLLSKGWLADTKYTRWAVGFAIGLCAQGIAEFVQSIPKLAQSNLLDAFKAVYARLAGKGAQ